MVQMRNHFLRNQAMTPKLQNNLYAFPVIWRGNGCKIKSLNSQLIMFSPSIVRGSFFYLIVQMRPLLAINWKLQPWTKERCQFQKWPIVQLCNDGTIAFCNGTKNWVPIIVTFRYVPDFLRWNSFPFQPKMELVLERRNGNAVPVHHWSAIICNWLEVPNRQGPLLT